MNRVREIVIEKLSSEENIKDGMDICLVRLKKNSTTIQYSGANRPLYVVENNELNEFKPDKQPVGRYEEIHSFSKQEISLTKQSTLYLTTDGYADQFGGERGKKIGSRTFKELIKKSSEFKNPDEQREFLFAFFKSWKGSEEQIADVTVIGIVI